MRVIEGDCLEVMNTLPRHSVDLVLTDPPYAMPAAYYTGRKVERRWSDSSIMQAWWRVVTHTFCGVLKPDGMMVTFANAGAVVAFWPAMYEVTTNLQLAVWDKERFGLGSFLRNQIEHIIVGAHGTGYGRESSVSNVFRYAPVPSRMRAHPAQKPRALLMRLAWQFCPDGGTVLDPFAGSLSTGYACDELGLDSICIEWEHDPGVPEPQKTMFAR